jgi:hypothetical protein
MHQDVLSKSAQTVLMRQKSTAAAEDIFRYLNLPGTGRTR